MNRRTTTENTEKPSPSPRPRDPRREVLEVIDHANALTLDFQHPELWEHTGLLFKPYSLQYFAVAALASEHRKHLEEHSQSSVEGPSTMETPPDMGRCSQE